MASNPAQGAAARPSEAKRPLGAFANFQATGSRLMYERPLSVLVVLLAAAVIVIVWHTYRQQSARMETQALQSARQMTDALVEFRTVYTSEVVEQVRQQGIMIAHAVVGAHINPFNESFRLFSVPDIWDRSELAGLAALEREVTRQAQMIAYSDSFLVAALIPLAVLPLVFLFRTPKRETAEG